MSFKVRVGILLLLLVGTAGYFMFARPGQNPLAILWSAIVTLGESDTRPVTDSGTTQVDKSGTLPLDEETKAKIRRYFEGVEVSSHENSVSYASKLDHKYGRKAVNAGREREAYDIYRKVLAISYYNNSLMGIQISMTMLAFIFGEMDNHDEALRAQFLGYRVARAMDNPAEYGLQELNLSRILAKADRSLGMMWRLRARDSLKGTRYKRDYVGLLEFLADDLRYVGKEAGARKLHKEAWEISKTLGNSIDDKWARWRAAHTYARALRRNGRCEDAIPIMLEALETFTAADQESEHYSYFLQDLAACYVTLGDDPAARDTFMAAYSFYELDRSNQLGDRGRARLDKSHTGLINRIINFYIDRGKHALALALLETNKARTLNDILGDTQQRDVYARWTELEQQHAQELAALYGIPHMISLLKGGRKGLHEDYLSLRRQQEHERRSARMQLEIREVPVSAAMTADDLEKIRQQLDEETAVLSFYISRAGLSAFLLTSKGIENIPLEIGYEEFRRAAKELSIALSNPFQDLYREPARRLHDRLFKPVARRLKGSVKTLVYSPDNLLSRVPLAAFYDGRTFVAEHYAIHRVPSLRYFKKVGPGNAVPPVYGIACVDPAVAEARLPRQRETGDVLKAMFGDRITELSGADCTPKRLEAALRSNTQPAFLHIGAHGTFYPQDAMESGLLLAADDGNPRGEFWDARAMGTVSMHHLKLVTISSCETGLTDPSHDRDVFGILRTLFFSGAQNVIAPLWIVLDRPTAQFMQSFYGFYVENGSMSASLKKVQKQLIDDPNYSHPYFWSGFVLTGGPA